MIGSLIGAGVQIAGSIIGGISAHRKARRAKAIAQSEKDENEDWYNRRYNEDATQRGDAQRMLTKTEEAIRNRNRGAAGAQAVIGGTEESVAATKQANAQALADATSQIVANADSRKDSIESQYRNSKSQLNNKLANIELNGASALQQAVAGVGSGMANLGSAIDDFREKGGK